MKNLPITNSTRICVVDDDIWLSQCRYKWRLKKSGTHDYVVRNKRIGGKVATIRLHRLVLNCNDSSLEVHHKDGDQLNNLRDNLVALPKKQHKSETSKKRWSNRND